MKTYDFPNGSRVISHFDLSPAQMDALKPLMERAAEFNAAEKAFEDTLPPGASFQFYGKWDCVVVREPRDEPADENGV